MNRRVSKLLFFGLHDAANSRIDFRLFYRDAPKVAEQLDELDKLLVYLCRYGRLTPEYVDSLEFDRASRIMSAVDSWIAAENGKRNDGDTAAEMMHDPAADFR